MAKTAPKKMISESVNSVKKNPFGTVAVVSGGKRKLPATKASDVTKKMTNFNPDASKTVPLIEYSYINGYITGDLTVYKNCDDAAKVQSGVQKYLYGDHQTVDSVTYPIDRNLYSILFGAWNTMGHIGVTDKDIWLNKKDFVFTATLDENHENIILECYSKHDKSRSQISICVSGTPSARLIRTLTIADCRGDLKFITEE